MHVAELVSCTVTELSLSADNVMVWALIIARIGLPVRLHKRVLAAGIAIALVLRVVAITAGAVALERLSWLTYVLAAVLVFTGYRIARSGDDETGDSKIIAAASRVLRSPALVAVAALGVTDLVFAVDSIPASFGVTSDALTIGVANGIALAALWFLYGAVSALMERFVYLSRGLAVVMVWLGVTMALQHVYAVPELVTLAVIVAALAVAAVASVAPARIVKRTLASIVGAAAIAVQLGLGMAQANAAPSDDVWNCDTSAAVVCGPVMADGYRLCKLVASTDWQWCATLAATRP